MEKIVSAKVEEIAINTTPVFQDLSGVGGLCIGILTNFGNYHVYNFRTEEVIKTVDVNKVVKEFNK